MKLSRVIGLVILVGCAGVFAWRQWLTAPKEIVAVFERSGVFAWRQLAPAPTMRARKPLDTFVDCGECPEMVMIPGGTFMMGSPADERGRASDEGPQRRVTIKPFAIGRTEVTLAEWEACVTAGGCNGYRPYDYGGGGGSHPVVDLCWRDAKAYVTWLSHYSGKAYRLPSEAEWEYAARAGTTTRYAFGDTITPKDANYSESGLGKTTEVGAYPPNAWGLHDMHGNVSEWVEDVPHSYEDALSDGSAWTDGETYSSPRVLRGGDWSERPELLRSASRNMYFPDYRGQGANRGFRVARTLD